MSHADRILACLDANLTSRIELTLYGRAALTLGFDETPEDYALSRDVDVVLWLGQAEALNESTNFWEAVDQTNKDLAEDELYVSHFFTEDQVVLLPDWRESRVALPGTYRHLDLYRLGDLDLLLSKLRCLRQSACLPYLHRRHRIGDRCPSFPPQKSGTVRLSCPALLLSVRDLPGHPFRASSRTVWYPGEGSNLRPTDSGL